MALLNKQALLSVDDFQYAIVPCPEWGGEIRVRGLTAAEQNIAQKRWNDGKSDDFDVLVCIMACVDENGERIFDSGDKELLRKRSFTVLDRIAKKIIELTGDSNDESVETAKKN